MKDESLTFLHLNPYLANFIDISIGIIFYNDMVIIIAHNIWFDNTVSVINRLFLCTWVMHHDVYHDIHLLVLLLLIEKKMALELFRAALSVTAGANCPCPALNIIFTADKLPSEPGSMLNSHVSFTPAHKHKCSRTPVSRTCKCSRTPYKKINTKSYQLVNCKLNLCLCMMKQPFTLTIWDIQTHFSLFAPLWHSGFGCKMQQFLYTRDGVPLITSIINTCLFTL